MAYLQTSNLLVQYDKAEFANYWLKFYLQGTVTPLSMATDAAAGTLLVKAPVDADGFFITGLAGPRFTPYINADYDCWLFPTEAEADANDTTNATQIADNIGLDQVDEWGFIQAATYVNATTFTLVGDQTANYQPGRRGYSTGGADRYWTIDTSVFGAVTTVTVKSTVDGSSPPVPSTLHASMDTAYVNINSPKQLANTGAVPFNDFDYYANQPLDGNTFFGMIPDGATINTAALQNVIDAASVSSYDDTASGFRLLSSRKIIRIPAGVYFIDGTINTPSATRTGLLTIEGDNAIIVQTAAVPTFNVESPSKILFQGLQVQGGTNAIFMTSTPNLDNSTVQIEDCMFQGQTDYAVWCDGTNMPKTLIIKRNNFLHCAGCIKSATNQTIVEDNWFEFTHTNPILWNIAQAQFNKNRIVPGNFLATKSKPTYWLVNDGSGSQLWVNDNVFSGEQNNASILLHVTNNAGTTHFIGNVGGTDADYNIVIDTFPISIKIERNWFQENNGTIINDNYLTLSPDDTNKKLTAERNTFKNNQTSQISGVPVFAFANAGAYFECDQHGFGRGAAEYEENFIDVQSDFANLFPQPSETWGTADGGAGTTITNNYDVAPDGATTAMRIQSAAGGNRLFNVDTGDLGATGDYVFSCWVRNVAGANSIGINNATDGKSVNSQQFNIFPTNDYVRIILPFYFDSADTFQVAWNLAASGDMVCWGRQINRGRTAAPYLDKVLNAKASVFPIVGVERPIMYSAAMPATGDYKIGQVVLNTAGSIDVNDLLILGWYRLTTGAAHVSGTDWAIMHVSHVTPAT